MADISYERLASIFKALSDETRLHIIDMLSCNKLCAADILASFNLSQSTLSYHMKILIDAGVVNSQRSGLWTRYSINADTFEFILDIIPQLYKTKDECICAQIKYCRLDEHQQAEA
ncbi:metalloregulator ArsR/SmtB family transcription factor [Veillonella sp.]|uniref:ArsR/SmtB family transcription factor n=1 Tax=Veillonella sp. TaxID=1926307 RepID=UPI001B70978F|nr:metalloregulator ArsR/SmtB family transcription factor [Veillonella sp.]MBP8617012.1 winged helix-turn-helix transcriptional regulator [Veillonella sp.]MBP9517516.1 winged helix-turn-helix transcriptional regulator [Veillonella sp.]MBP9551135.1 winged helix-turn-helix transcriptional regulator [Veillonella sp.]